MNYKINYNIEKNENALLIKKSIKNFIYLTKNKLFTFYLHREFDEDEETYMETFLVKSNNSKTGIVYYAFDLDNFCFFIHEGINTFYEINYEKIDLIEAKRHYSQLVCDDIEDLYMKASSNLKEIEKIAELY